MTRLVRGLIAGALLASMAATSVWSEAEYCVAVADDLNACPRVPEPELTPTTVSQDLAATPTDVAPADLAPVDQPITTTRTLGPPVVVNPFAGNAVPAAAQTEEIPRLGVTPAEPQKLPPGPPSRFP